MRRISEPVQGGTPAVTLLSETESERCLTAVELRMLEVAITDDGDIPSIVGRQLLRAQAVSRELTGYGAYVKLRLAEVGADDRIPVRKGVGNASIYIPTRKHPLMVLLDTEADGWASIELIPSDGDAWSADEVERVLFGDLKDVDVRKDHVGKLTHQSTAPPLYEQPILVKVVVGILALFLILFGFGSCGTFLASCSGHPPAWGINRGLGITIIPLSFFVGVALISAGVLLFVKIFRREKR